MKAAAYNLEGLLKQVQEMEAYKEDYVVPASQLKMTGDKHMDFGQVVYEVDDNAHTQIADKLNIPRQYYDRMVEVPGLRQHNVNAWMQNSGDSRRFMVRTYEGDKPRMRALLSDRFKVMDNALMLQAVIPTLHELPFHVKVESAMLSETRMYIKFYVPGLQGEVKQGDMVCLGASIRNSEIGAGAFDIELFALVLKCVNGLMMQSLIRKTHLGKRIEEDGNFMIYKDDTIALEMESLKLRTRDVLTDALTESRLITFMNQLKAADADVVKNAPRAVERITKRFALSPAMGQDILFDMAQAGEPSRWSLVNGITSLAKKQDNADTRYELEKLGGKVLELSTSEWSEVAA